MYEQLQDILNKYIEKGWVYQFIQKDNHCAYDGYGVYDLFGSYVSYHDLFSKDSGLIEFVEWKEKKFRTKYRPFLSGHVFGILGTPFEFWVMGSGGHIDCDSNFNGTIQQFHYMIMGPMTAEEKIKYFIDNVII